ncbi:hypothetical protein Sste5346_006550 [Sporothrix stenoceras]|uniref:Pectinesterase n=1 Tax=Sporothrix stenoceras TaxID=5173 RepID=A0ABR3YYE0_9PEZI
MDGVSASHTFKTISAAVTALDPKTTAVQTLFIMPGTYREQVYVPPLKGPLIIEGCTCDSRTYEGNTVTIQHSQSLGQLQDSLGENAAGADDDHTATLRLWTTAGLKVYNINIDNNFGPHPPSGGQALAVSASANGGQAFYACQFTGYQDTLLADADTQLYVGCLIRGAVDFIFGRMAQTWLDSCDIRVTGPGYITASGRPSAESPSWYVINNSTIDVDDNVDDDLAGKTYLGRPWAEYARVVVQNTYLGDVVNPAGWAPWSKAAGQEHTAHVLFGEYGNTGPSSDISQRVSFATQLPRTINIAAVLGSSWNSQWWVDGQYLE